MTTELKALPMAEALEFWLSKVKLSPREFYALAEQYRVLAFTVSRLARADMLAEIFEALYRAIQDGTSFEAWSKDLEPIWVENGWVGLQAWRIDTIFRTNIQTAYNVGRYKQMMLVSDARWPAVREADLVLVDVPCTGTGTLRRPPDGKWRLQPTDLSALVDATGTRTGLWVLAALSLGSFAAISVLAVRVRRWTRSTDRGAR